MDYKKTASGRINPVPSPSAPTPVLLKNFIQTGSDNNLFITRLDENSELGLADKAVIELLYRYGLRITEVLKIKQTDLFGNNLIQIKTLKTKEVRFISPITYANFWFSVYYYRLPLSSVFTRFYFYRLFKKLGYYKKYGQNENYSVTHFFRHQLVKDLEKQGMEKKDISKYLAHRSEKTLEYYVK